MNACIICSFWVKMLLEFSALPGVISVLVYLKTDHKNTVTNTSLLGIRMRIRCLMQSTWKVQNGEARSAVETTPCCPLPIRSRVSERSKSLRWWRASHFLSPLSCRLSSSVEQLTVFHTSGLVLASSSIFRVLDLDLHAITWWDPEWHVPKGT